MENKLDKLFRDKLENHSRQPSANTWEKVAASFPKKNDRLVWAWRIAAAIALLAFIGWYTFDSNTPTEQKQVANETPAEKKEPEVKAEQNVAKDHKVQATAPVSPNQAGTLTHNQSKTSFQPSEQQVAPIAKPEKEEIETEEIVQEELQPVLTLTSVEEVKETTALAGSAQQQKQTKAMVIVYNLDPIESKQEVEPVKVNGLKRVIEFAKDVKGGETTLASVRNWKDNFFGSAEQSRVEKQHN